VGLGLRAFRLAWGLPRYTFPDDTIHFIRPALAAVASGRLSPDDFVHPPLVFFVLSAIFWLWSALSGDTLRLPGYAASAHIATFTLVGRVATVAFSGLSIVALYGVAKRLLGTRAALFAAASFALAPLHVLESHRLDPDIPKILLALLALQLALDGAATGRVGLTLGGFGVAGLAAASKYTGLFAVAGPAWLALKADTTEGRGAARRVGLLAAGGGTAAIAFSFACVPCWCQFEGFLRGIRLVGTSAYLVGAPGVDLALGWPQHRYVYPLVVALPYMMGWPVYLAALLGFALVWRSRRATAALLLATTVPYFLFIGGGVSAVPRYYLLLCPFLALAAGATLDWLWQTTGTRRTLGRGIACAVIGYTALLSASQVLRLGLEPQRAVGALVARLAAQIGAKEGRKLVVAYPNRIILDYDAVASFLRTPNVKIVDFPPPYGHLATEPVTQARAADVRADVSAWATAEGVDVVVLPSPTENAARRARPDGFGITLFRELQRGGLGFRAAGDFRTSFLTEALYTWGDPTLDTHWETAIAGYKVFVREPG